MSELRPENGLAGLLSALQPRLVPDGPAIDVVAERAALQAEAWEAGFVAGAAEADTALAPLRAALADAAAAFDAACRIDADTLRPLVSALVGQVAAAVLLAELRAGAAVLQPLVDAALAAVRPGEAATLRAHPDTLAVLAPHSDIATVADTALAPGVFAVAGAEFSIDVDLAQRLADIVAGLA